MGAPDERTRSQVFESDDARGPHVLVMWDGGFVRRALPDGANVTVGRGDECTVQIIHPSISRRHVAIHAGHPPRVEDLGSTNGTRVGDRVLRRSSADLDFGQVVEAGPALIVVQGVAASPGNARSSSHPSSMAEVLKLLDLVARSELSLLILGETGVGKEVAAERVHARSPRAKGPLVKLNCAALPEQLLESELFGYERGAFTGATKTKEGLLETASGGTFVLDEVGEMPAPTQAKLLRSIENREVRRVGGLEPRPIDVRFIAATNRDLRALAAAGAFREDLYYRLNGMSVRIPPLRERRDEIPGLVQEFLVRACAKTNRAEPKVDARVMHLLVRHSWPGNIRELRNVVERALALCEGDLIGPAQIIIDQVEASPMINASSDLRGDLEAFEKARVVDALEQANGNQTKAAELLGITRRALVGRLEIYKLPRPRKR